MSGYILYSLCFQLLVSAEDGGIPQSRRSAPVRVEVKVIRNKFTPRFPPKEYRFKGLRQDADPGTAILTVQATDADNRVRKRLLKEVMILARALTSCNQLLEEILWKFSIIITFACIQLKCPWVWSIVYCREIGTKGRGVYHLLKLETWPHVAQGNLV